jgi:acyl-CoA synthetase (AMP-forming)/AMP-acid ligase II
MDKTAPPGPARPDALNSAVLPGFTFIDDAGQEQTVALAGETAKVNARAALLRERAKPGAIVGLIFRSGPELVIDWLASVVAGLRPLVMQYPTKKQSNAYWKDSVRNTVAVAGIEAIVCDDHCARLLAEGKHPVAVIAETELAALPAGDAAPFALADFAIVQLSSGTTGHRKAIEFTAAQLFDHVRDYNATLGLTKADTIVSWLPLYHDMGYVACFVMPMLFGIDVVMMDPMTWVRRPEFLYDAIDRHNGTVCYMPNFGFEVMARLGTRKLPSMRWWISCSEPVSAETAERFIAQTGVDPATFAPCYAMAENVFAVSIRRGLKVARIDQADVVSCGAPIPGVEAKIVDEQVWVRSPSSLQAYMAGADIRDADGFYPTGDLGRLIDGELHITGRAQDLLIQAGQKFMLSDIDLALNELYPWIKGRAAAVQTYDARLGTQKPVVLIETADFFLRHDQGEIAQALRDAAGLDQIDVQFVPPRFLTKTSSGKFNRKKSAADWLAVTHAREIRRAATGDPLGELKDSFGQVDWQKPVEEILDSLSLEVLRIILTGTGVAYDGARTLGQLAADLAARKTDDRAAVPDTIRIVSLADRAIFRRLRDKHIDMLSELLGAPVTFEHMCLPPSPVVLSDLIFHDYFEPRLPEANWTAVDRAFATLKSASLIIVDDTAEMLVGGSQTYGVLSHNLERDPVCDRISVRWQRYPQHHDELPLTFVTGQDLRFADRTKVLDQLSAYLGKPVFKIAGVDGMEAMTGDWDWRPTRTGAGGKAGRIVNGGEFAERLAAWLKDRAVEKYPAAGAPKLSMDDLGHFCSHFIDGEAADALADRYDRFCIVGQKASLPYFRKALEKRGKTYVTAMSYSPEILGKLPRDYDCVAICGPQGEYKVEGPAVALMRASRNWTFQHVDPEIEKLRFSTLFAKFPPTGSDWFYPFALDRKANIDALAAARLSSHAHNEAHRLAKEEKRLAWQKQQRRKKRWRERQAQREAEAKS